MSREGASVAADGGDVAGDGGDVPADDVAGDDGSVADDDGSVADDDGDVAVDDYEARAFALRERAEAAREAFEAPADPPARERAVAFARDGVGEAAAVYVDARTEESWVYFDEAAFDALEAALNDYLALFAACYGVDCDPGVTVRTAAETLLDTHDAVDTAAVLTGVDA